MTGATGIKLVLRTEAGLAGVATVSAADGAARHFVRANGSGKPEHDVPARVNPTDTGWHEVTAVVNSLRAGSGEGRALPEDPTTEVWQRRQANAEDSGELGWPIRQPVQPDMARLQRTIPVDAAPRKPQTGEHILNWHRNERVLEERAPPMVRQTGAVYRRTGLMLGTPEGEFPVVAVRRSVDYVKNDIVRTATFDELWVDIASTGGWRQLPWNSRTGTMHLDNRLRLRPHDTPTEWTELDGNGP